MLIKLAILTWFANVYQGIASQICVRSNLYNCNYLFRMQALCRFLILTFWN